MLIRSMEKREDLTPKAKRQIIFERILGEKQDKENKNLKAWENERSNTTGGIIKKYDRQSEKCRAKLSCVRKIQ